MAAIINYITAFLSALQDSIDAFRSDRPAKQAPTPEYAMTTPQQRLDDALHSLHKSVQRLEGAIDRLERKINDYLAACEREAEQQPTAKMPGTPANKASVAKASSCVVGNKLETDASVVRLTTSTR